MARPISMRSKRNSPAPLDLTGTVFPLLKQLETIVPDRLRLKFNFNVNFGLQTTAGSQPGCYVLEGNSIYTPDSASGGSGTCAGAYQWQALYKNFTVVRSRIHVVFNNQTPYVTKCVLIPMNVVTTNSYSTADLGEQDRAKVVICGADTGGQDLKIVESEFKTHEILGVTKNRVTSDPIFSGNLYTANPTALWYWGMSVQSIEGPSTLLLGIDAVVTYDTILYNRVIFT
jgi:hypothetical protein